MALLSRPDGTTTLRIWFGDEPVEAVPEDTVAAAMIAAGRPMTSRSPKYRRPRGPYCLTGDCGTCLVRVDGRPNLRACTTPVAPELRIEPQNTLGAAGLDPTAVFDRVFAGGFDHHHFMVRPRIANAVMQGVARELTGFGHLPDAPWTGSAEHVHRRSAVLVVGGGAAGTAAGLALAQAGIDHLVVERRTGTAVFGAYPDEGLWAGVAADARGETLWTLRADHVLLATGSVDPMTPFPGNDVPGVVAARGLLRLLESTGRRPAVPVVVVGRGPLAHACADRLAAELLAPEDVAGVLGTRAVEGVRTREGRALPCGLVAVAAPPAPASELARQAGARVRWDGAGFAVAREESGRCGRFGRAQLWAAGDVCGWQDPALARTDGERVAREIVRSVRELGGGDD